jgi:hypothetical protein
MSTGWPGSGSAGSACGTADQPSVGASMAAPRVAGAAAVLAGTGLDDEEIVERLVATASGGGTANPVTGFGVPDLDAASVGGATGVRPPARRVERRTIGA